MSTKESAQKMIRLLYEQPSGLHRDQLKRKCNLTSNSTFYRVLQYARKMASITCENETYTLAELLDNDDCTPRRYAVRLLPNCKKRLPYTTDRCSKNIHS